MRRRDNVKVKAKASSAPSSSSSVKKQPEQPKWKRTLWWIFTYVIAIYSVILAYRCNKHESKFIMIPVMILAWFFSPYYLAYYGLYHFILRVPCSMPVGTATANI